MGRQLVIRLLNRCVPAGMSLLIFVLVRAPETL